MLRLALHWQILIGMTVGAAIGLPLNGLAEAGVIPIVWPRTLAAMGQEIGRLFLQLLQMIVVPLIVTSLITGITRTGNVRGLGRIGSKTLVFYVGTSFLAIIVGLVLVNIIKPGAGADLQILEEAARDVAITSTIEPGVVTESQEGLGKIMWGLLFRLVPTNPVQAMAEGDILPVIFFSLMLGIFISLVGGKSGEMLTQFFAAGMEVMMGLTSFIIRLAPIGVLGFMLYATAGKGFGVFGSLIWYMVTVFLGLAIHATITLPLLLRIVARRPVWKHFKDMSPALLTAFSTASSNGTLPLTITCAEERAGISNRISAFVLPLGATLNMDGTALYEAVAVLFIAQAYGYDLTLAQQAIVAITALLASVGAAGIPHAGTVMMVIVLRAVGLPLEAVGLILAVDRVLDMCRTSVNVWGDSTAVAVIHSLEGSRGGEKTGRPENLPEP